MDNNISTFDQNNIENEALNLLRNDYTLSPEALEEFTNGKGADEDE